MTGLILPAFVGLIGSCESGIACQFFVSGRDDEEGLACGHVGQSAGEPAGFVSAGQTLIRGNDRLGHLVNNALDEAGFAGRWVEAAGAASVAQT